MTAIDDAAAILGVTLTPWQREYGMAVLNGEATHTQKTGRKTVLGRVLEEAKGRR